MRSLTWLLEVIGLITSSLVLFLFGVGIVMVMRWAAGFGELALFISAVVMLSSGVGIGKLFGSVFGSEESDEDHERTVPFHRLHGGHPEDKKIAGPLLILLPLGLGALVAYLR